MTDTNTEPAARNEPIQDLRQWLEAVEGIGELVKVSAPVNRDQEMSAIGYLLAKQQPSPTVMFEKAKGFEDGGIGARLLWNLAGPSLKRIAITLGEDSETPTIELIQKVKSKLMQRIPPCEVAADEAPREEERALDSVCQSVLSGPPGPEGDGVEGARPLGGKP